MPFDKSLRSLWQQAGYNLPRGSSAVTRPPPPEFLRVYHLTSEPWAIADISLRRLKVARFSELNDPFEMLSVAVRDHHVQEAVSALKEKYNSHTGLLCFSDDWINPVLWSHYANKHRGICLGFDVTREDLWKVEYEGTRVAAQLEEQAGAQSLPADLERKLRCTKYKHWEYESERRVFVRLQDLQAEGGFYFRGFHAGMRLSEVILGQCCPLDLATVRAMVTSSYPEVVTYRARLAIISYSVVPDEETVP